MIKKEITINHSLDDIRNALTAIATKHPTKYKKLNFDESFSVIKIWGDINLGAGVSIEIYYEELEPNKVKVRIEYVGSGTRRQAINEENEASFEKEFSALFSKYLKGDVDEKGVASGSGSGCVLSALVLVAASMAVFYGVCALIVSF